MATIQATINLEAKTPGTITDFKYSPTGQFIAVADSEGYVTIYTKKENKSFLKVSQFKADQGSIWSIAWGDAKYGNIIGIGSFRNKVAIYQQSANTWKQIAYHDLHTSSVNWVQFSQFGLKLFAGSSDGQISILELSHKSWKSHSFVVSQSAIATFALQQFPLGEAVAEQNAEKIYPRLATVSKDQKIRIWAHQSEKFYSNNTEIFDKKGGKPRKTDYHLVRQYAIPKQTIRTILWRPSWENLQDSLSKTEVLTCSQEGFVKIITISTSTNDGDRTKILLETENQITKVSQSLTGNLVTVSMVNKSHQETVVIEQNEEDWKVIHKGKL